MNRRRSVVLLLGVVFAWSTGGLPTYAQVSPSQSDRSSVGRDDPSVQGAARAKRERLLKIYASEAAEYTIYRDASRKDRVELVREPVYVWTNPVRNGGQDGVVYVWTCQGRAEVLGCFFSFPATGRRALYHEFHSLSLSVLEVNRAGTHPKSWTPRAPGIEIVPISAASAPGRSAPQRLAQMRLLAHDFSASTTDHERRRWELRLLPQPLYRYMSTDPDVLDGALFAFVTSAGTDPEALLVIEARKPAHADNPAWHYGVARFTDLELRMRLKGGEIFSAPLYTSQGDPKERHGGSRDRIIPPVEERAP
jgi:hypothetical protein